MRALVQQVPPYRALRSLQAVAADGWADGVALRYPSHAELAPPFRGKAVDMRPTAHGWVDTAPGRGAPGSPGPAQETLSGLFERVRRYFAVNSAVGAVGSAEQERGLARVCLMLARFEAGVAPERGATAEEVHQGVPGEEVREVARLIAGLRSALPARWIARFPCPACWPWGADRCEGWPSRCSRGWAEGDLVIGGTLVAVCLGGQAEVARRLRHLVAQVWLDDGDRYRVRQVALFTGIPNTLLCWPPAAPGSPPARSPSAAATTPTATSPTAPPAPCGASPAPTGAPPASTRLCSGATSSKCSP